MPTTQISGKKFNLPSCFHLKAHHVAFGTSPTVLLVSTRTKFEQHASRLAAPLTIGTSQELPVSDPQTMTCFLSVAVTALVVLASRVLGSRGSTASSHGGMVRFLFEVENETLS
jgi:hypothetical protein